MKTAARVPRSVAVTTAAGVASALTGAILLSTPAFAATSEIVGSATVVLDFSTVGEVDVEITTQNLSGVPAYGAAYVAAPDGQRYAWGPRLYAAGEVWVYTKLLTGYTCDDLTAVSAAAFGFADLADESPEWTTGVVRYPDARVTVIGCDTSTEPPAEEPGTEEPETGTPETETPSASGTPGTSTGVNKLPPSKTDGALLASTSPSGTAAFGGALLAGAAAMFATAGGLLARDRRARRPRAE